MEKKSPMKFPKEEPKKMISANSKATSPNPEGSEDISKSSKTNAVMLSLIKNMDTIVYMRRNIVELIRDLEILLREYHFLPYNSSKKSTKFLLHLVLSISFVLSLLSHPPNLSFSSFFAA